MSTYQHENYAEESEQRSNLRALPTITRKLPAQPEAEEQLLASLMLDGANQVPKCLRARLKPEHFYDPKHGAVYEKIVALHRSGRPTDVDCVAIELGSRLDELGGYPFLLQVSKATPTTAQATYFLEKVLEAAMLRAAIKLGALAVEECHGHADSPAPLLAKFAQKFVRLAEAAAGVHAKDSMLELAQAATARGLAAIAGKKDRSRELVTGMPHLDAKILPFNVVDEDWMVVLAAPPSVGKSSLAAQVAFANLRRGKRMIVFLLETGATAWLMRLAARHARVDVRNLDRELAERVAVFKQTQQEIEGWIAEGRLYVYDNIFAIEAIEMKVREIGRLWRDKEIARGVPEEQARGLDGAIFDYLQLITPANLKAPREQQVADISRRLKLLLKLENLTGFVLAQLNRKSRDEERRPRQSDLRESGAIEQDADRIGMLHIPKKGRDGCEQDENTGTLLMEFLQVKSRNGPQGIVDLLFHRRTTRFEDAPYKGEVRPGAPKPAGGYKRE